MKSTAKGSALKGVAQLLIPDNEGTQQLGNVEPWKRHGVMWQQRSPVDSVITHKKGGSCENEHRSRDKNEGKYSIVNESHDTSPTVRITWVQSLLGLAPGRGDAQCKTPTRSMSLAIPNNKSLAVLQYLGAPGFEFQKQ